MNKHMTQEVAIKSAWMILEGLGYDRAQNGELEKTVTAVYESAPAADVVEVVRCRECVYWEPASPTRISGNCNRSFEISSWAHDFCSYGERKDGGQDDG